MSIADKILIPAKETYPFELPKLDYAYDALSDVIDAQTMEIHHTKHHQGYTDKLNAALKDHSDLHGKTITQLLEGLDSLPEDIQGAVRNNGGGYLNHAMFWKLMTPGGNDNRSEGLNLAIEKGFGGLPGLKEKFTGAAKGQFGSGWGWFGWHPDKDMIHAAGLPNQDHPVLHGGVPFLGVDVWEHAYYLKYQNKRPDYVEAWWSLINWEFVSELHAHATK